MTAEGKETKTLYVAHKLLYSIKRNESNKQIPVLWKSIKRRTTSACDQSFTDWS